MIILVATAFICIYSAINNFEEINFFFQSNVAKIASNISNRFRLIYRFVLYCSRLEYPLIASSPDGHFGILHF